MWRWITNLNTQCATGGFNTFRPNKFWCYCHNDCPGTSQPHNLFFLSYKFRHNILVWAGVPHFTLVELFHFSEHTLYYKALWAVTLAVLQIFCYSSLWPTGSFSSINLNKIIWHLWPCEEVLIKWFLWSRLDAQSHLEEVWMKNETVLHKWKIPNQNITKTLNMTTPL